MINDPLLNTTAQDVPPAPPVARTARTNTRKKHPAISARILATGLSATALIGLTSGYTLSQKVSAAQPTIPESIVSNVAQKSPIDAGVITQTSQVIYVPVPGAVAATAGTPSVQVQAPAPVAAAAPAKAPAPAATTQQSSGSN
jgi:hypothetical protein